MSTKFKLFGFYEHCVHRIFKYHRLLTNLRSLDTYTCSAILISEYDNLQKWYHKLLLLFVDVSVILPFHSISRLHAPIRISKNTCIKIKNGGKALQANCMKPGFENSMQSDQLTPNLLNTILNCNKPRKNTDDFFRKKVLLMYVYLLNFFFCFLFKGQVR